MTIRVVKRVETIIGVYRNLSQTRICQLHICYLHNLRTCLQRRQRDTAQIFFVGTGKLYMSFCKQQVNPIRELPRQHRLTHKSCDGSFNLL